MKPAQLDRPFPPRVPAAADTERDTLSAWDAVYALNMAIACPVIYWVITGLLYGLSIRLLTSCAVCGLS